MNRYESSKAMYAKIGVKTDLAIEKLKNILVSLHCWHGEFADREWIDDVKKYETEVLKLRYT